MKDKHIAGFSAVVFFILGIAQQNDKLSYLASVWVGFYLILDKLDK